MNDQQIDVTSKSRVPYPYHAWLAPLAGYAAAVILNIGMTMTIGGEQQQSRILLLIAGLVPLCGWLACHVLGYVKSIQCLIGKRHLAHGIVGLIVNTLSVIFMVLMIIALLVALNTARQNAAQQQGAQSQNQYQTSP